MIERTVDLWQYLPEFLKQFLELDKLFEAEQPQFQLIVHKQMELLNNMFIQTATDEGLKRFEKIVGIYPNPGETIDLRRTNVLAAWFSNTMYTMKVLLTRLQMLQGNDNVQLTWDEDDCYLLHIKTHLEQIGQVDSLYQILEMMLPANIAYESINEILFEKNIIQYYGVGLVGTGYFFLTNDFNETVSSILPAYVGAGMVEAGTLFGTNDFNETVDSNMVLYMASGIVGTGYLFLTDDLNEHVEIRGNVFVGMANTTTEFISTN